MLVFKCKIKILVIIQLTYILYHFKTNILYFKYSWIIKPKQTSLASMAVILHSTFERNISLAFQARLTFLSKVSCNIRAILVIRSVLELYICMQSFIVPEKNSCVYCKKKVIFFSGLWFQVSLF